MSVAVIAPDLVAASSAGEERDDRTPQCGSSGSKCVLMGSSSASSPSISA